MTDELRAKFDAWYPDVIGDVQPFDCYMEGHASRDAEVEALIRKYEKRSMYEDGGLYSNIIDDLQELIGK